MQQCNKAAIQQCSKATATTAAMQQQNLQK